MNLCKYRRYFAKSKILGLKKGYDFYYFFLTYIYRYYHSNLLKRYENQKEKLGV
jgi:hypothetical protein